MNPNKASNAEKTTFTISLYEISAIIKGGGRLCYHLPVSGRGVTTGGSGCSQYHLVEKMLLTLSWGGRRGCGVLSAYRDSILCYIDSKLLYYVHFMVGGC
jgi:hypothetical protein